MASRAKSISIDALAEKTHSVARDVLSQRIKDIGGRPGDITYFPDIGIFGLIWDDLDFGRLPVETLLKTSAEITEGMGDLARHEIEPVVVIGRHGTTMGYFPRIDEIIVHKGGF